MFFRSYSFVFVLLLTVFCPLNAQPSKLNGLDDFVNNKALKHASVGVCIKDMDGKEILALNADKSLTPASTLKLVTTASALELLGADYVFKTTLAWDESGGKLIVSGSGDPTLGSEFMMNTDFLPEWVKQICEKVKSSDFDIVVDDSFFGYEGLSPKWIREDIGNYFAPGCYGISVFDNSYRIYLDSRRSDSCPVILKTVPAMPDMNFLNCLGVNKSNRDNGYVLGEPFSNERRLSGDIPAGRKSFCIKGSIPDPGLFLGQSLLPPLVKAGFTVPSVYTTRNIKDVSKGFPDNFAVGVNTAFYTHKSPFLSDIIRVVNERSNNHYAEHIIRAIGRKSVADDIFSNPLADGIAAVDSLWKANGLDTDALFMFDGCGLAPSDAVSPEFMCDLLVFMRTKSRNRDVFLSSLPKAGSEGTVRNFMKECGLKGSVFVKSGSISNVKCYAGYYIGTDKKFAFSIMVNNYNGPSSVIVKAIERLLSANFR